jgi:hypothetical protein
MSMKCTWGIKNTFKEEGVKIKARRLQEDNKSNKI